MNNLHFRDLQKGSVFFLAIPTTDTIERIIVTQIEVKNDVAYIRGIGPLTNKGEDSIIYPTDCGLVDDDKRHKGSLNLSFSTYDEARDYIDSIPSCVIEDRKFQLEF